MSIWTRNGKVIVDDKGRPIECDQCPCDKNIYSIYLFHTYTCDPEELPSGGGSEPVAKKVMHYINPEFPEQDNGKDFFELRQKKSSGEYLPEGWYSECAKYDRNDGNFFYTYDENGNLHTWFFMKDADPIDFINPTYNLQYMKEKEFLETHHGNLFECEAPEIPEVPENSKQWLRITYSPNADFTEWLVSTKIFSTSHPFCSVPFGDGETLSFLDVCEEEETDYEGVWRGGTMCPADGTYQNEEDRNDSKCPIVVDIPYEVCGEISEDLIDNAISENMPTEDRMKECEPMCALFLCHIFDCKKENMPESGKRPVAKQLCHTQEAESLFDSNSLDFFYTIDETNDASLPEGWYSSCAKYENEHFVVWKDTKYYHMESSNVQIHTSDFYTRTFHLSYVPYSYLQNKNFDTREIEAKRIDIPYQDGVPIQQSQWLRITYSAAYGADDWSARYDIITTEYPYIAVPFGNGKKIEVQTLCKDELSELSDVWDGGCMAPYQAKYENEEEKDESRCPVVCDIRFESCGEIPEDVIQSEIESHKPDKDQIQECSVSYNFVTQTRTGQTFTSLHTEINDVTYVHHKEEYDGEIYEWDEPVYEYIGIGATVSEEVWEDGYQKFKELSRWVVDAHEYECYYWQDGSKVYTTQKIGPFCDDLIGELSSQASAAAGVVRNYLSNKSNFNYLRGDNGNHIQTSTTKIIHASVSPDSPGKDHSFSYRGAYADCYYGSYADHRFVNQWYSVGIERNEETPSSAVGVSFLVTVREYVRSRRAGENIGSEPQRELVDEQEKEMSLYFGERQELPLPSKFDMVHIQDKAECEEESIAYGGCRYNLSCDGDFCGVYGKPWKNYETYAPGCCANSGFRGYYCEDNHGSYWSGDIEHSFEYHFRATGYLYRTSGNSSSLSSLSSKALSSVSLSSAITSSHIAPEYSEIYADLDDSLKQDSCILEIEQ